MTDAQALRHQLRAAGYCPIPLYGKEPPIYGTNNKTKGLKRWQELHDVNAEQIDLWTKTWPDAINTGCLCRFMPTLDLDILSEDAVRALVDHVREHYEELGHILPRIGKPPKCAIPFRTEEPFKKIAVNLIAADGSEGQKIEFLADGEQVVVAGIHPDIGQPYRWPRGELGATRLGELPYIREAAAHELVETLIEILVRDFGYQRAPSRPQKRQAGNAAKLDGGQGKGETDWTHLYDNIREGRELHDTLRTLAAKMIAAGTNSGAAINQLRSLMEGSKAPKDERWRARVREIPDAVDSAVAKYGKQPEPAEPQPKPKAPPEEVPKQPEPATIPARSLVQVREVFRKWFGPEFDMATLDAVLAVTAAAKLGGDPAWLLVISGSGNAKTETVSSVISLAGAHVVSTITSEGALLSATSKKNSAKGATGGLLRKIGSNGILVIKDFTSILSIDRNVRTSIIAALREIHDGRWERNVGTDGGRTLSWAGHIIIIGACTTAWDQAHAVVSSMGDRFVLIRSDSHKGRLQAGQRAIKNTGAEVTLRKEMATAVAGLIGNIKTPHPRDLVLCDDEENCILQAADIVTLARTGVETDYRGDVIDAHAPEMPTRFAKQLTQIMRGGLALGMARAEALTLALRCARDSIPQLRLAVLLDLQENNDSSVREIRHRLQKPYRTIKRSLEALHALDLILYREEELNEEDRKRGKPSEFYSLTTATLVALDALKTSARRGPA